MTRECDYEEPVISVGHGLEGTPRSISEQIWDRPDLGNLTLGDLRPGLEYQSTLFPPPLSVRTTNCLYRSGINTWENLAQLSVSQILGIPQMGRKSFLELASFSLRAEGGEPQPGPVEAAIECAELERPKQNEHEAEVESFMRSLREATLATGARSLVEVAQRMESEFLGGYSTPTQLDKLLDLPTPDSETWSAFFDFTAGDLEILDRRVLVVRNPATLSQLASDIGVTRERVRQRQKLIEEKLSKRLFNDPSFQGIQLMVKRFEGDVVTAIVLEDLIETAELIVVRSGIPAASSIRGAQLLIKFGGPFEERGGLMMAGEVLSQFEDLQAAIMEVPHGSLVSDPVVRKGFYDAAISGMFPKGFLHETLGVREIQGSLVHWGGSMSDKAYGAIAASGSALDLDDIHLLVGFDRNPRSLAVQIQSDPRITRQGKSIYGLAEWGNPVYHGVESSMELAIRAAGGRIKMGDLIQQLEDQFSIAETSIRSYSSGRRFAKDEEGYVVLNTQATSPRSVADPRFAKALVLRNGSWNLKVEVDDEILRGSGRPISQTAAVVAGLEHDVVLGYDYGGEVVTFSWLGRQPTMGSIKTTLDALGAKHGDLAFLPLESEEPRDVALVTAGFQSGLSGVELLGALLGIEARENDGELRERISTSIGLPRNSDWEDIRERLVARREHDLAGLVPSQ